VVGLGYIAAMEKVFRKFTGNILWIFTCILSGACNTTCSGSVSGNVTVNGGEMPVVDSVDSGKGEDVGGSPQAACLNGEMAMTHVQELVSFAPRHAGTEGQRKTRDYIASVLTQTGLSPVRDRFTAYTPHPDFPEVEMENISVRFDGSTPKRVLITGHFDGKIIEKGTFYGANDGGSSTGLLLEMARCLKKHPPEQSVELVFLDGEEALVNWTDSDSLYGSKHFVGRLMETGERTQIAAVVNVDMVGDARLAFVDERNSTAWVFNALRQTAVEMGQGALFSGPAGAVEDDHVPFLAVQIPAANLIDFRYGPGWQSNAYWHTEDDDMSHIAAESMRVTGQIVLTALPRLLAGP
jgi:glutaminyl-peptide cyclotransferase